MKRRLIALAVCAACNELAAATEPSQGDFGGVGLLQTPTARMAPEGFLSFNANKVKPYTRFSLSLQPFDWFEAVYRYTSVSTVLYGPSIAGNQSTKDKAFDFKVRLAKESHWLPEVALGARDIAGTALFSGEYLVANKRINDFDFSVGLGWGYVGKRGDIDNPLGVLYQGFKTRPSGKTGQGGLVGFNTLFRGPATLFGGVQWQTPWAPLKLQLEYEGNNYRNDYGGASVKQDSPLNLGATYRVNDSVVLHAAWERGNTAMIGITLQGDLSSRKPAPPKVSDPAAEPMRQELARPSMAANWADVAQRLEGSAGYKVSRITQREREVVVHGEQTRYFHPAVGIGRSARVLDNSAGPDIDWLTVIDSRNGLPIAETSVRRATFHRALKEDVPLEALHRTTEVVEPLPRLETTLYQAPPPAPFDWGTNIGYKQSLGGPDGFVLYQFNANLDAEYHFTPGTWLKGIVSANLLNNYDNFKYTAPSNLPRVRTYIREYLTSSDLTMPVLQLTHAKQVQPDLYGMLYGGYLETMYAGIGGELLYRPLNSNLAFGVDINYVKQRDFKQDFALRDYSVMTGHLSSYYRGIPGVLLTTSAGRYLAGDYGLTFDVAREFDNGVRFGAWATFTNVSSAQFGEGSFDKGFYISIPFDEITTRSTQRRANFVISPLTRDGGARLARESRLYDITEGRNLDFFHQNFQRIKD
ncbi:MAG: hypothetical protein H6R15_1196 [Proteobacteria bacterium]|nr:hypothetical protein [Pseudomonadota bacterium]